MGKLLLGFFILLFIAIGGGYFYFGVPEESVSRVYWLIPDGMRADPEVFNIFQWAKEGKLPNIKKLMDEGSYGFSIPDFPSHTPTNWASLMTGTRPDVHGISDGPMHVEGYPLEKPSVAGFGSQAKKVDPIWKLLEGAGKKVALLSIPGSTPPELKNGITIRGRWGPWGFDTPAVVFEPTEKLEERKKTGKGFKLFYLGQKLTQFVDKSVASGWLSPKTSYNPPIEIKLNEYGAVIWGLVTDSTDNGKKDYDTVTFSFDKKNEITTLKQGEWSEWIPVTLKWKEASVESDMMIKVIKLWEGGNFRIRIFYNNVNEFHTEPSFVAKEMTDAIGPMVDFVDNWPAQLIYEEEDKETFYEEAMMSLDWHKSAAGFILDKYQPDFFIQDTYTPNQMLESRWWHGKMAGKEQKYDTKDVASSEWEDVYTMYKKLDDILGEAMKHLDKNSLIVLSSDHGIIPIYKQLKINNLFAEKGWLKYTIDPVTGEPAIDWNKTKVIYLKMAYVYINPDGLGGNWKRGAGPEYEALRKEVIETLRNVQDDNGIRPVVETVNWEDAPEYLDLPKERVGDLVLEVAPGYQLWEEVDASQGLFGQPLTTGYKQAVNPKTTKGLWTPFVIAGPGVKKGHALPAPINHVDQLPTIFRLYNNIPIPDYIQGRVLDEILK